MGNAHHPSFTQTGNSARRARRLRRQPARRATPGTRFCSRAHSAPSAGTSTASAAAISLQCAVWFQVGNTNYNIRHNVCTTCDALLQEMDRPRHCAYRQKTQQQRACRRALRQTVATSLATVQPGTGQRLSRENLFIATVRALPADNANPRVVGRTIDLLIARGRIR